MATAATDPNSTAAWVTMLPRSPKCLEAGDMRTIVEETLASVRLIQNEAGETLLQDDLFGQNETRRELFLTTLDRVRSKDECY